MIFNQFVGIIIPRQSLLSAKRTIIQRYTNEWRLFGYPSFVSMRHKTLLPIQRDLVVYADVYELSAEILITFNRNEVLFTWSKCFFGLRQDVEYLIIAAEPFGRERQYAVYIDLYVIVMEHIEFQTVNLVPSHLFRRNRFA